MTDQNQLFVDAYLHCLNGAKAAVAAGYAEGSAKQQAYRLLRDPEIKQAVAAGLSELHMSWEESARRIANNASTRLNDYLICETVIESHMVRVPLPELIEALELEKRIEADIFDQSDLTEEQQDLYFDEQKERDTKILRYQVELRHNPNAYRDMPQNRIVEKVTVDLKAIKEADEQGAVKKLSFNERGLPSVEMYPADKAQETILKLHGKLVEKHDHTSGGLSFMDLLKEVSTVDDQTRTDDDDQ